MSGRVLQGFALAVAAGGLIALADCTKAPRATSPAISDALRGQLAREYAFIATETAMKARQQPPRDGALIGELAIPRLGISTEVVEGDDVNDLKVAPGHIPGTALPGEHGNVGIAAHRDTFFRPLQFIREGDTLGLTTMYGTFQYRVVSATVVSRTDTRLLYPTGHDTLTLVTCYPFYFVGSAPKRFILRADPA